MRKRQVKKAGRALRAEINKRIASGAKGRWSPKCYRQVARIAGYQYPAFAKAVG